MRTSRPVRLEPISTKISTTCLTSFVSIISPSRSLWISASMAVRTSRFTALKTISWKLCEPTSASSGSESRLT